jgi:hypothetical protein
MGYEVSGHHRGSLVMELNQAQIGQAVIAMTRFNGQADN